MPPHAPFSLSHSSYPVAPLAPSDSVCSAPFLPPVTGSPFPFSPPVPLGHSANGASGMAAAEYVAASYDKLKAAAATMVQTKPNSRRSWMGAKIELPATKKAASKVAKAKSQAAAKKDKKRKRDDSDDDDDSDTDTDTASSGSSSASSSSGSDSDTRSASIRRRLAGSSASSAGFAPKRKKQLSKKERNKMSASAYRKRKKAHIDALHGVADTLKVTVAEQSDLIDSITSENKALREQLSFIQKLLGSSSAFLMPKKEQSKRKGKDGEKEAVKGDKETVGAPLPVALPASPKLAPKLSTPSVVAPMATVNAMGHVTLLSAEAEKLDLSALVSKAATAETEVTVKQEVPATPEVNKGTADTTPATTVVAASQMSASQRAGIFLFVIFTCFLLFNPNSLHEPLSDITFNQLTASFLDHQYNGGIDLPYATFTSQLPLLSLSPSALLTASASAFPSTAATACSFSLSPEAVMRQFLGGGLGGEAFFAAVLERTYAPLVRLVGEEATQSAIMRLAGGMLSLQLKRQQAAADVSTQVGGYVKEDGPEVVKAEQEAEVVVECGGGAVGATLVVDAAVVAQSMDCA